MKLKSSGPGFNVCGNSRTSWLTGAATGVLAFSGAIGFAADGTWTGSSSGAWLTTGNWSGAVVPGSKTVTTNTDIANIASGTTQASNIGINMNTQAGTEYLGAFSISGTSTTGVQVSNSSGTVTGVLTLNGATVNSVSNVIIRNSSAANFTITNGSSTMGLALGNSTNNVVVIDGAANVTIASAISGSGKKLSVQGSGSGDLILSGTNSFSGGIDIAGSGRLRLGATAALPTTGDLSVSDAGRLRFAVAGTYGSSTQTLTFNPNQTATPSLDLQTSNIAVTLATKVALNADTRIESNGATGSLTFSGNLSGSGTLIKQAGGNLILSGTGNTATGATQIGNGTLTVNSGSSMGTGALTLAQTATNNTALVLNNTTQTVGSLSSTWTATTGTQTQTITLNGTALTVNQTADGTFGTGAVSTLTSTLGGTGSLTKSGSSALTLGGTQTYSGATLVSAGSLFINGSLSNTSGTTVSNTATLAGNGSIANGVSVASGGTLAIGTNDADATLGTLTLGSLGLSGLLEMGATGALTYDKLITTGAMNLSGGTVAFRTSGYTIGFNTSFDLADFGSGSDLSGTSFDFTGAAVTPYGAWDTSAFAASGIITYVPEPGTALLGGLGALALLRRRR